jgi:hypothetical protein
VSADRSDGQASCAAEARKYKTQHILKAVLLVNGVPDAMGGVPAVASVALGILEQIYIFGSFAGLCVYRDE